MNARTLLALFGGLVLTAVMVASVEAQVTVRAGGASAGTPFATEVPLNLCDAVADHTDPNVPRLYINGSMTGIVPGQTGTLTNGKILIWRCKRASVDVRMAYSATGSGDGILKLLQPESDPASNMNFFNEDTATCNPPVNKTRPSDGKLYVERSNCAAGTTAVALPINVGWSDVFGTTFGQTGPPTAFILPQDQSSLSSAQVAIVPFAMVLGNGVVEVDRTTTPPTVKGPVKSLSQLQVESIFSEGVTNWWQLGIGTAAICTGAGTPHAGCTGSGGMAPAGSPLEDPSMSNTTLSKISRCMRRAGSGTKAAYDATVMQIGTETPFGSSNLANAADGNYFGTSNQDIRDCIAGNTSTSPVRAAHPRAVGYMEADQAHQLVTTANPGSTQPGGYIVRLDGYLAVDTQYGALGTLAAKNDLVCGLFQYWVGERFNTRNPASADADVVNLIDAYRASASAAGTIAIVPAGAWWTAPGDMNVTKTDDRGPLTFKVSPPYGNCVIH
jgi:ABC-type phosphate transport system substrate-binding protein